MTVVRDEKGEGHAVLTARTVQGDFILDNKIDEVKVVAPHALRVHHAPVLSQPADLDVARPEGGKLHLADGGRSARALSRLRNQCRPGSPSANSRV